MAAITFPLSLADFADLLSIESVTPAMKRNDQIDGLESGLILASETAPALRTMTVKIRPLAYDEDADVSALIEALDGSINPFYMYQPPRLYPRADPTGALLGASVVTIGELDADNKRMTLHGLPVGYKISRGDCLSFNFSAGTLRAYHRVVSADILADIDGHAVVEVRPHFNPGTVLGTVVTLKKPAFKAIMIPDSYNEGDVGGTKVTGKSFQIIQRY